MKLARPLAPLAALLVLCGCSGRVAGPGTPPSGDAAASKDAETPGHDATARADAGVLLDAGPDCGQPTSPTYDCSSIDGGTDAGGCHAYGADAASGPTYPLNCTVTLSTCNLNFGGAQTCDCQIFPGSHPGPAWICPL